MLKDVSSSYSLSPALIFLTEYQHMYSSHDWYQMMNGHAGLLVLVVRGNNWIDTAADSFSTYVMTC